MKKLTSEHAIEEQKLSSVDNVIFQNLDIKSDKGKESLRQERIMLRRIEKVWGARLIETDKDTVAKVDGIIEKDKVIRGVYESKCRDVSYIQLCKYGSWLITHNKILQGQIMSKSLMVPYLGLLYLVSDDKIFYWKITNKNGDFIFDFEVRDTETRKTINGGKIIRENAYLPLKYAYEIT